MRIGPQDRFWLVTDATPESTLGDVLAEVTLGELELQFKGGLTIADNPAIFTDEDEAEQEAQRRLVAVKTAELIARYGIRGAALPEGTEVRLVDGEGNVLYATKID